MDSCCYLHMLLPTRFRVSLKLRYLRCMTRARVILITPSIGMPVRLGTVTGVEKSQADLPVCDKE